MKTFLLLLIFISYTYAFIDESALTSLQTIGKNIRSTIYQNNLSNIF